MNYYFLDEDGNPQPTPSIWEMSLEESGNYWTWLEANKRVKETTLGDFWISTVFLGIDHSFMDNESPVLWETMITKNGEFLDYQRRYVSQADAEYGHDKIVELLGNEFTKGQILDG